MTAKAFPEYRIISTNLLVQAITDGRYNSERFCFILGSGASQSSGIPTGAALEYQWMKEIDAAGRMEEIRDLASKLKKDKQLEHDFKEIENAWKRSDPSRPVLPSKYYFDIYKLRFSPNHRNGYYELERMMANAEPSFGYHPLAQMLTDGTGSNLVITTNFDSLIEDALFLYTKSKPLVINHELLADYAGSPNIRRPIIAKIHRGIFFDPLNAPEETKKLKGGWHEVLAEVFRIYTPIVIGYGGGDNSLMELLQEKNVVMKNGIYWCYMENHGLPNPTIQKLVLEKRGWLVRTAGFDAAMLSIGNALYPDRIDVHATREHLQNQAYTRIERYAKAYQDLTEQADDDAQENASESGSEFKAELEKMKERETASVQKRQAENKMTAWDYWSQGNGYYKKEDYERAIDSFSAAIDAMPNTVFYCFRGTSYLKTRNFEKALEDFTAAIELDPDNATAYNNRAYTYNAFGQYEKALADCDRAIELKPDSAPAHSNRACAYNALGDYEKALIDAAEAARLKPELPTAYKHLGVAYKMRGDLNSALTALTKAIELNPKFKEAYQERAEVYRRMGEPEKAAADEAAADPLPSVAPQF